MLVHLTQLNIAGKFMDRDILIKEGWEKRGIYDEPRLSEICEMYKELGFDVLVFPYEPDYDGLCNQCFDSNFDSKKFKVVYTKKG